MMRLQPILGRRQQGQVQGDNQQQVGLPGQKLHRPGRVLESSAAIHRHHLPLHCALMDWLPRYQP